MRLALVPIALILVACAEAPAPPSAKEAVASPSAEGLPAGDYRLDPAHSTLVFKVSHLGFSQYVASFARFDATLTLDPARPDAATLSATIDPTSLILPAPPDGFAQELAGPNWIGAGPITFRSTEIERTGPATANIRGELTIKGATRPVTLEARFNGGYPGMAMDPNARIGFSAAGAFKRSDFGISYGIPAPGSNLGVGDEVAFEIETEWTGPGWAGNAGN